MPARISSATFSCDSLLVYASFLDGSIGVFDSDFRRPSCRIAHSAQWQSPAATGTTASNIGYESDLNDYFVN